MGLHPTKKARLIGTRPLSVGVLALVAVLASASQPNRGATDTLPGYVYGQVVKIADGYTRTILTGGKEQLRVRLSEIDTPERGQPYARKAQDELSSLVWQEDIAVKVVDADRYGRTVGRIYVRGIDVAHRPGSGMTMRQDTALRPRSGSPSA